MVHSEHSALEIAASQSEKCFLCKWIAEDLRKNGKLTGYPEDGMGAGTFPATGKEKHIAIERALLKA
jgi:hypothetical protein